MRAFLQSQPAKLAPQIGALLRAHGYAKAASNEDELLALEDIIAQIDFTGWAGLVGDIDDTLAEIAKDGAYAALEQVGLDVTADKSVANVVNDFALDYGKQRSAEMVGMRVNAAGDLVQNPNAVWQITEGTREGIRATVEDAMREGWSNDKIAASLQDAYAFSDSRAMMIARTETQLAANKGALEGYKASGVVEGKQWITAEDDLVSEECQENADAGELALDADFPSGDDAPPVHPNCRCSIVPVVMQAKEEEQTTTDEETVTQETTATQEEQAPIVETHEAPAAVITDAAMDAVAATAEAEAAMPDLRFFGDLPEATQDIMRATVDSIPDGVLALMADKGVTFNFGEKLIDIMPELKGVRPRGYPRGMTWEHSNGLFDNGDGRVVVGTSKRTAIGARAPYKDVDYAPTIRHEAGHGFDYALGNAQGKISATPEFNKVYWQDRRAMTAAQRDALSYYMQKGDAGPSEAFAEIFASIVNGGENRSYRQGMFELFPNVRAFIEDKIAEYES